MSLLNLSLAAALLAALSTSSLAQSSGLPFKLKPLYLDTVIADDGRAMAVVAVPDDPKYGGTAESVRKAVKEAAGVDLPVRRASEMANGFGQLIGAPPNRNLILIAGPNSNNLLTHLSRTGYCSIETDYPGPGGSVFRTIHNPWGNGVNAILLGGSDIQGVQQAVDRFILGINEARKGESTAGGLVVRRTMDIVLPKPASEPTDEEIKAELAKQRVLFKEGQQGGLFTPITRAGGAYGRTGKEGYAKLYRDLLFLEDELRREATGSYDSPWGGAADFLFGGLIDTWETVEESPSLSDADREKILAIILDYAHFYLGYGTTKGMENQVLRNNHNTFTNIGFLKAGIYFDKYYKLSEARQWIENSKLCFQPHMKSFKSQEDCSGYGWITMRHNCNYCYAASDYSWFRSGKAGLAGDLYIMTTDNLGHQATFGDVGGWTGNGQAALWLTLNDVERKGRWAWAIRKVKGSLEPGTTVHGVEPVEPTDLFGVQCRVTEPMFYSLFKGRYPAPPQERTFDKISMRTSFDPDKPYLLLDGINYGYHGHQDGNSILRLTDRNRIWLADCDYIKSLPRYHNSMLILRDGQTGRIPTFAECELVADLQNTGFTSTTLRDYAGTDWRRNIIWDKGGVFVVIDEVVAKEANDFSARCLWQTLGMPKLEEHLFQVSQKGATFSILNLDEARLRYSDDAEMGKNWAGYPYADPVVHTLQQVQTKKLGAGESICFINVLASTVGMEAPRAERVNAHSVLIGEADDQALVGMGVNKRPSYGEPMVGLVTDAQVYWISKKRIALGGCTGLDTFWGPKFSSRRPISIEFDTEGNAELIAPEDTTLSISNPINVRMDGRLVKARTGSFSDPWLMDVAAGRHRLSGLPTFRVELPKPSPAPAQDQGVPMGSRKLVEAQQAAPGAKILSLTANANGVFAGRADGWLQSVSGDHRWSVDVGDAVTAVWVGKLATSPLTPPLKREGDTRIAAGTSKGKIILLDMYGQKLWDRQLPVYKAIPLVEYFTSADLSGDGNRALIIGSDNWHHHAYDSAGNELWNYISIRGSTCGTAVDLDGDGKQEAVVGTEYNQIHAINPDGTRKWSLSRIGGPRISAILPVSFADASPGVVFGGAEGTVYAYDAEGKQKWNYGTGDEVTCMASAGSMILAGSRSFSVTAIDNAGERVWRTDLGEPVLSMALADLDGDDASEIAIGTEDGHVVVMNLKGEVLATWNTQGPVRKLAAFGDKLAVACEDGRLMLLKME